MDWEHLEHAGSGPPGREAPGFRAHAELRPAQDERSQNREVFGMRFEQQRDSAPIDKELLYGQQSSPGNGIGTAEAGLILYRPHPECIDIPKTSKMYAALGGRT